MIALCCLFFVSALLWFKESILRPEYVIVLIGLIVGIARGKASSLSLCRTEIGLLIAIAVAGAATVAGQILSGAAFIWRDLMVTLMIGYYASVMAFVSMTSCYAKADKGASFFGLSLSVVIAAISIFQYFNLLNINSFMLSSSDTAEWLRDGVSWKRTVGTIGNPNYWGFVISAALAFLTHAVFWRGRILYLPLFLCLLASLILTGSRSALICWAAGTLIGGIIVAVSVKELPRVGITMAAALSLLIGIFGLGVTDYYENRERFSTTNVDTLLARMNVWADAWRTTTQDFLSLFLGQGPRKGIDTRHFGDNSYVKLFRDYGLVSLFLYISFLGTMLKRSLHLLRIQSGEGRSWAVGLLFVLIQWCVFELTADTWFFVRVSAPMLALYAYIIAKIESSPNTLMAQN